MKIVTAEHTFGVRVDGPTARGLWPPDGGGLCRRVVKGKVLKMDGPSAQRFLSLTALRAEGCGIALTGDEYYNAAFRRSRSYRVS